MHWSVIAIVTALVSWLVRALTASYVVSTVQAHWPDVWAKLGSPEPARIWFSRAFSDFDAAVLSRRFRRMGIKNRDILLQLKLVFGLEPKTFSLLIRSDTKLACLTIFALGGKSNNATVLESEYFAVRATLAEAGGEASKFLAQKGLSKAGAPAVLLRLISVVAARFGVVVSEKAAAQAFPVIGAVGGALVNTLFIGHFQDMARGHFIVRRLETLYGKEPVMKAYQEISRALRAAFGSLMGESKTPTTSDRSSIFQR